jgi:hypothetical protein
MLFIHCKPLTACLTNGSASSHNVAFINSYNGYSDRINMNDLEISNSRNFPILKHFAIKFSTLMHLINIYFVLKFLIKILSRSKVINQKLCDRINMRVRADY